MCVYRRTGRRVSKITDVNYAIVPSYTFSSLVDKCVQHMYFEIYLLRLQLKI